MAASGRFTRMRAEAASPIDHAEAALPAGPLHWLRAGALEVAVAPAAGGRIAQLRHDGVEWLVGEGEGEGGQAAIAWGCYPMVPWAGRIRRGRFEFDGVARSLPINFERHAIHGLGFSRPWQVDDVAGNAMTLSLALPEDAYWPFGGTVVQTLRVQPHRLQLHLVVQAGDNAMPAALGWHPWFRKPDRLLFSPEAMYPRDGEGIATLPRVPPVPGPWDDCFVAGGEIALLGAGQRLRLRSDCDHWVVYDRAGHATCVEPQTGPPNGFTLAPHRLEPGEALAMAFELEWEQARGSGPG